MKKIKDLWSFLVYCTVYCTETSKTLDVSLQLRESEDVYRLCLSFDSWV